MPRQGNKGKSPSGSKSVKLGPGFPPQLLNRLLRSQRRCIPFRNTFPTMHNTSQCSRGIPNKSDSEQKYDNFYYSSPKAATDMGVSSSESHDLTAFYEMLMASFGVLSQNTGFYPSLDRIVETMLRPLNLGPGGGSCNKPISHLQHVTKAVKSHSSGIEVTLKKYNGRLKQLSQLWGKGGIVKDAWLPPPLEKDGLYKWMLTRIFGVTMTLHSLMNCHCGWYPSCPDGHELPLRGHALWSREGQSSSVAARRV